MFTVMLRYNLKHALKVDTIYRRIRSSIEHIKSQSKNVFLRKQYMLHALEQGEFSSIEYTHWKRSQSV